MTESEALVPTTMTTLLHDEHLELKDNKLHILSEEPDDFSVWLNTEVGDFDGLCIGVGATREAAIVDAAVTLEKASLALRKGKDPAACG